LEVRFGSKADILIASRHVRFDPKSGHANERLLKELTGPSQFGSSLVALARPREIRTLRNLRCELSLWPLTFLNYTKKTKYEALEKNAVSELKMPQLGNLQYSCNSRKAPFYWEIFGLFFDGEIGWPV
jgi:hypothetical protein